MPYPPLLTRCLVSIANSVNEEPALFRKPMPDKEWQQLLHVLRDRFALLDQEEVGTLMRLAEERIQWLDGVMARYCTATCPYCEDPCCDGRQVFFNRTDLLWLLALNEGKSEPSGQTRTHPADPCRYLDLKGCKLPRLLRPYVCVWFLCDAQMNLLKDEPAIFQRHFIRVLQETRVLRLKLESLYRHHFPAEDDLLTKHPQ